MIAFGNLAQTNPFERSIQHCLRKGENSEFQTEQTAATQGYVKDR